MSRLASSTAGRGSECSWFFLLGAVIYGTAFWLRVGVAGQMSVIDLALSPLALPLAIAFPDSESSIGVGVGILEALLGGLLSVAVVKLIRDEKALVKGMAVTGIAFVMTLLALVLPFGH